MNKLDKYVKKRGVIYIYIYSNCIAEELFKYM